MAQSSIPRLDDLRQLREQIHELALRHHAHRIRVTGSVARGDAGPDSDYDFLVDLEPGLGGFESFHELDQLERELRELLRRPVHVVTAGGDSRFAARVARDARDL